MPTTPLREMAVKRRRGSAKPSPEPGERVRLNGTSALDRHSSEPDSGSSPALRGRWRAKRAGGGSRSAQNRGHLLVVLPTRMPPPPRFSWFPPPPPRGGDRSGVVGGGGGPGPDGGVGARAPARVKIAEPGAGALGVG